MPQLEPTSTSHSPRGARIAQWAAYLVAVGIVFRAEWVRWSEQSSMGLGPIHRLLHFNVNTTLAGLILLLAPPAWLLRDGIQWRRRDVLADFGRFLARLCTPGARPAERADWRTWSLAILIGFVSLGESAWVGRAFGDLPPAYHDEYSYLFQAKTFLAGRLSFPSHEAARIFDQMHVLNEGRFASRYFPGTGLWMAPFLAGGHPYWGHWLAGALTAMLIFWTGRELGGIGTGFIAGMLTALSPGMALFSNLLLSHHPCMVGIASFLYGFIRWRNTRSWGSALLAGAGLSFAMLCRPVTAAGIGLPFGIVFLWTLCSRPSGPAVEAPRFRVASLLAMGVPLLVGIVGMFCYNYGVTGNVGVSPYQLYTDIYTPRHVYGFHNRTRGEAKLGSRQLPVVTRNYDEWAEDLTPALAAKNSWERLNASWQWSLGIIPLVLALVAWLGTGTGRERGWWLIFAGIVSLHAVHVPYWYDGIMHWHYVFESGPLWLLLFAGATASLLQRWAIECRPWMPVWWGVLIAATCVSSQVAFEPFWRSRLEEAIHEVRFSRVKYAKFRGLIAKNVTQRPALVLVQPDPDDRHIDYVINDPSLDGPVLFGRFVPQEMSLAEIVAHFPNRHVYLYRAKQNDLKYVQRPSGSADASGKNHERR